MHPDFSLVLQKCASNLSLKHKQPILFKAFNNFKDIQMSAMASAEVTNSCSQGDSEDLLRIVSDEEEEIEGATEEETRQYFQKLPSPKADHNEDNISLCSELSVGRENPEANAHNDLEEDEVLDISDIHSNSSTEEMQHSPIRNSPIEASINPFALANTLRFPVPFGLQPNVTTTAPNISPFQEEFLRKSHLYAEELMKHQMQLMAAARASAFSLRSNNLPQLQHTAQLTAASNLVHLNPLAKIGQLSAAAAAALTAAAQQNKPLNPSAHHILQTHHGHYPYTTATDTLARLTDLSKQHVPSSAVPGTTVNTSTQHMMSTLNQLQTQMKAHLPGLLHDNNDNLHERALKFSIDNILKADFGRSISLDSPSQLGKTNAHKTHITRNKLNTSTTSSSNTNTASTITNIISMDAVEHPINHISPSTQTFSSSLATICTNSNDSSSTAVSSSYGSVNGCTSASIDLLKSSPSQTPCLSPGFLANNENNSSSKSLAGRCEESSMTATTTTTNTGTGASGSGPIVWPAWVYCTRYSDRPSSGPRVRKPKAPKTNNTTPTVSAVTLGGTEKANSPSSSSSANTNEDKRPRTAFSGSQLARLKHEFNENRYLTEKRRQQLSSELGLNEAQIKIWFQNKRAKLKKSSGVKNPLALQLMAQGLYNHSTIPLTREEEELQELQEREKNNNNNNNLQQQPAASTVSS